MTLKKDILSTPEGVQSWHQERVIFETTNMLCDIMLDTGVSRTELAKRLGRTKGYVTQLLDGSANMTLRTVSDVFLALGRAFQPGHSRLKAEDGGSECEPFEFEITFDMSGKVQPTDIGALGLLAAECI